MKPRVEERWTVLEAGIILWWLNNPSLFGGEEEHSSEIGTLRVKLQRVDFG
jgi:hypothetical protein